MRWFFVRESIGIRKDSIPVSPGKRNWRLCFRFSCGRDWSLLAASLRLTPLSISEFSKTLSRDEIASVAVLGKRSAGKSALKDPENTSLSTIVRIGIPRCVRNVFFGAERGTRTPTSFLSPADFKLRRLAGVSEAGACCRNPERSAAESKDPEGILPYQSVEAIGDSSLRSECFLWCREGDSNPHELFEPCGF